MEFLAAKRAALRRQRLGDAAADIVEAHTPPVVVNETKQRAQQARDAAAKRAERQNTFVAGVLAKGNAGIPEISEDRILPHLQYDKRVQRKRRIQELFPMRSV
jgi:hypothetical protein